MENQKQIKKELEFHSLDNLVIVSEYFRYEPQTFEDDRSLQFSLKDRGLKEPFTAIRSGDNLNLLNGNRRHTILSDLYGPKYEVPVWVISESLNEEEIQWLILDLAKVRKKTNVDYVNEFHIYNKLVPNNQGKKNNPISRRQLLAQYMGVSSSKISLLLSIDADAPEQLKAVDNGIITLSQAKIKAKEIREHKEQLQKGFQDNDDVPELIITGKHRNKTIDLDSVATHCSHCNRSFDSIEWHEIPMIFNKNRNDKNNQTDWLQN